jgi:Protein of unknown function (DUF1194)/PEP-CTERM motif
MRSLRHFCTLIPRFCLVLLGIMSLTCGTSRASNVDTEIVILVDAKTGPAGDFTLLLESVAASFERQSFYTAVSQGAYGKISASVMLFNHSNSTGQSIGIPWMELTSQQDLLNFAQSVRGLTRGPQTGTTNYATALTAAANYINTPTSVGTNSQISIIDDASSFSAANAATVLAARNAALASGVDIINAMVIDGGAQAATINTFYQANIISSTGTVNVLTNAANGAKSAATIASINAGSNTAISGPTITVVPEPSSLLLLALGSICLVRRQR